MSALLRAVRLLAHLFVSGGAVLWFTLARRSAPLVFRHEPDVDDTGRDVQMGPLLEELERRGTPWVEVVFVPLTAPGERGLLRTLARWRRPFVSHAALLVLRRLTGSPRAIGALLALWGVRVLYLIDESGSGQLLLRAARARGLPVVGVQHGDFQPSNPQYAGPRGERLAVDLLAVWSPWFRERLLAVSELYREAASAPRVEVVGRLAHGAAPSLPERTDTLRAEPVRVLVIAEREAAFRGAVLPYLQALDAGAGPRFTLRLRLHPGAGAEAWPASLARSSGTLEDDMHWADVVVGRTSSALLEALWHGLPAVCLAPGATGGAADLVSQGVLEPCEDPETFSELLVRASSRTAAERERVRTRVWGDAPRNPAAELLRLGSELQLNGSPPGCRFERS